MTHQPDPAAKPAASNGRGVILPNLLRRQDLGIREKNSNDRTIGNGNHPA